MRPLFLMTIGIALTTILFMVLDNSIIHSVEGVREELQLLPIHNVSLLTTTAATSPVETDLKGTSRGGRNTIFPSPEMSLIHAFLFPSLYRCLDPAEGKSRPAPRYGSQFGEDKWLYEYIYSNKTLSPGSLFGRTYFEIGALDGIMFSNTLWFEGKFDWRGILMEGHPRTAERLRKNMDASQRPNSYSIGAAACNFEKDNNKLGQVEFVIGMHPAMGFQKGVVSDNIRIGTVKNRVMATVNSSCIPVQTVLEATGLYDIDLFSLDVEGAETFVLDTIDLSVINVHVFIIEMTTEYTESNQRVRNIMKKNGFVTSVSLGLPQAGEPCHKYSSCGISTPNEAFINLRYFERKRKDPQRYKYGTGERC